MSVEDAIAASPHIPIDGGEPVFAEPWEARAFALAVALNEAGVFSWSEWAQAFGAALKADAGAGGCRSYYEIWWQTLEVLSERHGLVSGDERQKRALAWQAAAARTPHGRPIEL